MYIFFYFQVSTNYQLNQRGELADKLEKLQRGGRMLIWNQTDVRLIPNQSESGKYCLISI